MKEKNEMPVIYETDNIAQSKIIANRNKNISVIYCNPNITISPILTFKINGISYKKWNPEYVEYLRKKHPSISDKEIKRCMELAIAQLEVSETDKEKKDDNSLQTGRKR